MNAEYLERLANILKGTNVNASEQNALIRWAVDYAKEKHPFLFKDAQIFINKKEIFADQDFDTPDGFIKIYLPEFLEAYYEYKKL